MTDPFDSSEGFIIEEKKFNYSLILKMIINENEFNKKVSGSNAPIIIFFGAEWSGNSEMLSNLLQNLDEEFNDQVDLCLTDIDNNPDLADQYGISEVPTTLIFNEGEVVDFFKGLVSKSRIRQKIESLLVF